MQRGEGDQVKFIDFRFERKVNCMMQQRMRGKSFISYKFLG